MDFCTITLCRVRILCLEEHKKHVHGSKPLGVGSWNCEIFREQWTYISVQSYQVSQGVLLVWWFLGCRPWSFWYQGTRTEVTVENRCDDTSITKAKYEQRDLSEFHVVYPSSAIDPLNSATRGRSLTAWHTTWTLKPEILSNILDSCTLHLV